MRYDLFDYQRDAAIQVLDRLSTASMLASASKLSAFALSAVTGSGKTVIATAVIEALLHGSADLAVDPDPSAVFLWVTDDPALNKQTVKRMHESSELLQPSQLIELGNGFLDSELSPGRAYFLNIQKLAKKSGLAHGGNNLRQYSMWEVLGNTVDNPATNLCLILDEAQRGMKQSRNRSTIVQRIINGSAPGGRPVPTVWGISATIERYEKAMKQIEGRIPLEPVEVDVARVQASGLIKDQIHVELPSESGTFSKTFLNNAVDEIVEVSKRWEQYAADEDDQLVEPVLVVQVEDTPSEETLAELTSTIVSRWPGLEPHAIVNVFGEHKSLDVGNLVIRYVSPEEIQDDPEARVVLAKEAISTGWDCPRAEVLYSARPANDATHIAQIIGRMVRQPLARRIVTDTALNSVSCFVPRFNRAAVEEIKRYLEAPGEPPVRIITETEDCVRRPDLDQSVFDLVESLPSIPTPDVLTSPLRRARVLTKLLTDDSVPGGALVPGAGDLLTKKLNLSAAASGVKYEDEVAAEVQNLTTAEITRETITPGGETITTIERVQRTNKGDIRRDAQRITASIKEGAGKDYLRYCAEHPKAPDDPMAIRVKVAAVLKVPGTRESLDDAANEFVREQLKTHAAAIAHTTGAIRDSYARVQEITPIPERSMIELPTTDRVESAILEVDPNDNNGSIRVPFPRFKGHLLCGTDTEYPAKLNKWESEVLAVEMDRDSFVAWYRNPPRGTRPSLRIAYLDEAEKWRSLRVDFVIVSRRGDGSLAASIVDPHGGHLSDARAKLVALSDYAEKYGSEFARITSVAKVDGTYRVLEHTSASIRAAVRAFTDADVTGLFRDVGAEYM